MAGESTPQTELTVLGVEYPKAIYYRYAANFPARGDHQKDYRAFVQTYGRLMGIEASEAIDPEDPGTPVFRGQLEAPVTVQELADRLSVALDRTPLVIGEGDVTSLAWCTGAGQGYIDLAADAGADVYVTGEVSEQTAHVALERGIAFIGAGHHATERYGVQAVGSLAAEALGLSHEFIDIDNPA